MQEQEAEHSYIEQHSLSRPVAVWVMNDAEIDIDQMRELSRHFSYADCGGTKFVIRPVSPHIEAEVLLEKARDSGFRAFVDDGYYEDELWPPRAAVSREYLLFALAEVAVKAWCRERVLGELEQREVVLACELLFVHMGWLGRSGLGQIIEVACDGLCLPDGCAADATDLSDAVRRLIEPLVRESVATMSEIEAEEIAR
jgi:hypothetical protein